MGKYQQYPIIMQYEELDLHSHTLKRPDTYVGSTVADTTTEYVYVDHKIIKKSIQYIPAVMRIFIEALSNALDNVIRSRQYNVPCKTIKVHIDPSTGQTRSDWASGRAPGLSARVKNSLKVA